MTDPTTPAQSAAFGQVASVASGAAQGAWDALAQVGDAGARVHWLALVGAAVVAVAVRARHATPAQRRPWALLRWLLPRRLWLHPSALADLRLMLLRGAIDAVAVTPVLLSAFAAARFVSDGLDRVLGVPRGDVVGSSAVVTALYTVMLFIAWDFSRYLLHRLAHEVPLLWRFHAVHHSAEVLTPWSLYRTHPVEGVLAALRGVAVTGVVTGMFFWAFRGRAVAAELLGVNAIGFVFNVAGANLRHSHVWLSYGPRVERWLLSPAQHQVHHGDRPDQHHRNYGTWLAIWDRLGGSLRTTTAAPEAITFGLPADGLGHRPRSAWSMLVDPLRLWR